MPTGAYYIPSGPKNLSAMFPEINWIDVERYFIEVTGATATSPVFEVQGCDEDVVISFINYSGAVDSIGFSVTVEHESKSSSFQRPSAYPLVKAQPGTMRFGIKSNNNYTGTIVVPEDLMDWISELVDTPLAWMQIKGLQGQSDDYVPVVITDQSIVKLKDADRFQYEVTLKWSLSHERVIISN